MMRSKVRNYYTGLTSSVHASTNDLVGISEAGNQPICFSPCRADSVKISTPVAVTPTECSNCADSERSRVTAVQPSERIFTCGLARLIIGSVGEENAGPHGAPSRAA